MSIRIKLLLCFLSFSMLTFIAGILFYIQLKQLIEPLTYSTPTSVEALGRTLDRNDFIYRLLYQQVLVNRSLENYVATKKLDYLQYYNEYEELLSQLLKKSRRTEPTLVHEVEKEFQQAEKLRRHIITLMQSGNVQAARQVITSDEYFDLVEKARRILNRYYEEYGIIFNEASSITVKLAAKNTITILKDSLNTMMMIFIDTIIISLALAFIGARAISRPIKLLQDDIERMNMESLNIPISPELLGLTGEVGALARSFVDLIEKLRTTTVLRDELLVEIERRRQYEAALSQAAIQLQESNRELDKFAYIASHDLRAPLRGIENLAGWIEEDCYQLLPEGSRHHFDLLKRRIYRLDNLITGILEYSRAGRMSTNIETINVNKLISEVIDNLAPDEDINIYIDNTMPSLAVNKVSMTQVFLNLISNAIKYHDKPKSEIHVGFKRIGKYYQFYVADDGPGIDPQYHEKIFNIFQTLQSRDTIESTGIGLAIVKKIIEKQGGRIWVESALGQGSTFYFTWPKDPIKWE
jgi:signal transduction histidine kinase